MVPELMGASKKGAAHGGRHRANTPPPVSTSCCDCFEIDLTSPTRTCKWCGCYKSQHTCESSATGDAAIADVGRTDSMEVTPDREAVAAATAAQKAAAATATQRAAAYCRPEGEYET